MNIMEEIRVIRSCTEIVANDINIYTKAYLQHSSPGSVAVAVQLLLLHSMTAVLTDQ